ncbi:MAG: radical SAM/SPASM domain-containing protein [Clostridium celatum]|uniref:radical SAM/SPASM domain-containing protein n=1 Tax=Clostridium sp. TaxID=1506 RepID=UPI0025BC9B8B|nr:radical SAM/SPASM domain-containing protein [Clostridium sp.]MBS4957958.1 radical SAM protein [Clostridium sp.]MDU4884703.1 radical SAM/SPASM domain-containing protein [Clostridium celatum]MDU5262260.1 radical SAM/SPASM domain-containing protein [Clostridium celatum]MDU7077927.1 radical SAM/SPASM domain-containing protein [Clostridium celatum]
MRKFKKVYIEITNVCNLSCNFCPKTKRKYKFMNKEEFTYILNEVKPFTEHIYFHLMGEPLLNEDIEYFFEESRNKGLHVNLTTNGTLLSKVGDKLIKAKSLRQVNISLHSFEANKKTVELEEYLDSVTDFIIKARENSDIICAIRLWNMDNDDLKGENNLNKDILKMLEDKLKLDFSLSEKLQESNRIKLKDKVYLNMAEKFQWPDIKIDSLGENVFCHGLRNQIGILVDGTVVPCCLDSEGNLALGNIFERPLKEVLTGDRATNIYNGFSRRVAVESLCKKCGYATRFKK